MNYKAVYERLKNTAKLGSKLGLDNTVCLCGLLGDPQDRLKFVHVAGTNGKGSTCAMVASILTAAGYKTGLYLSPYLRDYRDSYYINGKMISEADFADVISAVYEQADRMEEAGMYPTEFEILTAGAFLWFCQNRCDIVILETGMGGRLDATNIIKTPLVSVLTTISYDHHLFLGDTIKKITGEKSGIIKKNGITVSYPEQTDAAFGVIKKTAQEKDNIIITPDIDKLNIICSGLEGTCFEYRGVKLYIALGGRHQAKNAVTAIETVRALNQYHGFMISDDAVKNGLETTYLPGRQEVLCRNPLIILDGAHNLQGIEALENTINSSIKNHPLVVVMGMLSDKQYEQSIAIMAKRCDKFIAVSPDNPRALDVSVAAGIAGKYCSNVASYDEVNKALADAVMSSGNNGAVIICGSLYLASKIRDAIKKLFVN